jgi:hypothetical protein
MAQTKIEQGLLKFTEATDYLKIPTGTTAQRPSSPANGYIRFNTTINDVEAYNGTEWTRMGVAPPTFTSVDYPGSATALDPAGGESLVINGTNFNAGITITIDGTTPSSITRNSDTQLTVTAPAKAAGTYNIVFTNSDGGTATAINAVSYNGVPAFTNAAGSLGSVDENSTVSLSAAATEPDGGAITYAITSGSLPSGLSLNSSTGAITGTASSVSADTTSNFTITATDNENQTASRAYSITVTNILPSNSFKTVTYTGNGSTQSITGVGFKPDFVWLKRRDGTHGHRLIDSSTGADKYLESSSTASQQGAGGGGLTSFDSDGFSVGSGAAHNINTGTFVAWCWKLNGGTTSSNTDGTITSSVQVNQNLGFSIATYTGTGATASVGHGLGQKPDFVIIKHTNDASAWVVFSDATGTFSYSYLNLQSAFAAYSPMSWDSSVLNLNSGGDQNGTGDTHIAYFFTSKEGFSKIGSYTGNGSTNGPIIQTGFEPAFLLIKRADSTGDWRILDNKRNLTNPRNSTLKPNLTEIELTGNNEKVDFLSNGFQIKNSHSGRNTNGGTYIYMAFAADPDTTAPTLADSFNISTYTGNSSTQSISGFGFQPNLIWIKNRTNAYSHQLYDSVRGAGNDKNIQSDNTSAEGTDANLYGFISSFDSDGYTVQSGTSAGFTNIWTNQSGQNYVAWAWKADDALPTINTDGDINSIVSANSNAGFSIVKYIGDGSTSLRGIGHGLSSAPELIIQKSITNPSTYGTSNWRVGGTVLGGAGKYMYLNLTNSVATNSNEWGNTQPDTTKFYVSGTAERSANESGIDYINYCFHSVSGYNKIGSYTGNGSASGPVVTTGFQPDFLMVKRTDSNSDWAIIDSARGSHVFPTLFSNLTSAELTSGDNRPWIEFQSNGFQPKNGSSNFNLSGGTYIYMAFKIN